MIRCCAQQWYDFLPHHLFHFRGTPKATAASSTPGKTPGAEPTDSSA
jgi:hypothetical protein